MTLWKVGKKEVQVPLVQGGMGVGISLGRLAGTVAKQGGVGIIFTAQIGFRESDFDQRTADLLVIEEPKAGGNAGKSHLESIHETCYARREDSSYSMSWMPCKMQTFRYTILHYGRTHCRSRRQSRRCTFILWGKCI